MTLTYGSYLKIEELLVLQQPASDPEEHDELLFIVIHQVYELWFKLLLHELEKAGGDLSANRLYEGIATFQRARTVMKTLVGQLDVLETMTPMSFASFRDRLDTASGFQSVQFRELEFLLGFRRPELLRYHPEGGPARRILEARLSEPSIVDRLYDFLEQRGAEIPQHLRERDRRCSTEADGKVQEALLRLYRESPDVAILLELLTDFDEGLQEWRYRHVKMVERTIGNKHGTGGSPGAAFLRKSLFQPIFPDLWAIRHRF